MENGSSFKFRTFTVCNWNKLYLKLCVKFTVTVGMNLCNHCIFCRYISEDSKVRQQLVEAGMVATLARLVKSEELELVGYVIRTLSELWTKMNKRFFTDFFWCWFSEYSLFINNLSYDSAVYLVSGGYLHEKIWNYDCQHQYLAI